MTMFPRSVVQYPLLERLKECNICRDKHFSRGWIKTPIAFLMTSIPKKNTTCRPRWEFFMMELKVVDKTDTTKDLRKEIMERPWREDQGIRNLFTKDRAGHTIDEVTRSQKSFRPKVFGNIHGKKQPSCNIEQMHMFPLSHSILLRCMRTRFHG